MYHKKNLQLLKCSSEKNTHAKNKHGKTFTMFYSIQMVKDLHYRYKIFIYTHKAYSRQGQDNCGMNYEGVSFGQDIQTTKSVRVLCATIWMEKYCESFSMLLFCTYLIFLVNISTVVKIFMMDEKNARFYLCLKLICEKSKSMVFM